jgi:hypothetical protein
MLISELKKKLDWWEETFGDVPVTLSVKTCDPSLSRGDILDVLCNVNRGKVDRVILFGGRDARNKS